MSFLNCYISLITNQTQRTITTIGKYQQQSHNQDPNELFGKFYAKRACHVVKMKHDDAIF